MRREKFVLVLDDFRYDLILLSLIEMKNHLINEGRFTDYREARASLTYTRVFAHKNVKS